MLGGVSSRVDRIARALLPDHEQADEHVVLRARLGVVVIGALALVAVARVPLLVARGPVAQAVVLALCAGAAVLVPVLSRTLGSFVYAAHALVGLTLAPIVSVIHFSGGAVSPALLVLLLTPMIAVFLTGRRGGVAWTLVAGSVILIYAVLDRLGLSPPIRFTPETWKVSKALGAFATLVASLGIALGYERARSLAEKRAADAALRADSRIAESESVHKRSLAWLGESLAHEANNTLAYVMADLARLDPPGEAAPDVARLGAERLRRLVRDMKTVTTGDACTAPTRQSVDVERLVDDVLRELAPLLSRLGIAIHRRKAGAPVHALADPTAFAHCVASALIAFAPETRIDLGVEPGARPALLLRTTSGLVDQRPLSLEAARLTLEALGGSLAVESSSDGVSIRFELLAAAPPPARLPSQSPAAPEDRELRVLIVDDEPLILQTAKRLLDAHDVTTTTSPRKALELIRTQPFDAVVCDFNMPEMRGDVLLATAVELGFDPGRFILMTGNGAEAMDHFRGQCPKVLEKPYTRHQLEGAIRQVTAAAIE